MAELGDGSPAPERLHALDAVRGFALLLGVVYHATISFVPSQAKIWIVEDSHRSTALAVLFFIIHVFRMTTFFLVAGFFAHMSFHRRGTKIFIRDRLKRIALPLLLGWPLVFASILAVGAWAAIPMDGAHRAAAPPPWPILPKFPLTHLWFLYVLLEFYAAALVLRAGVVMVDKTGRFRRSIDNLVSLLMRNPLAPVFLAVPVGIAFAADPNWLMFFGVKTPDTSLVTNAQAWIGYGTAFGFGWLLHRQMDLVRIMEQRWILNLLFAIGLVAISLAIAGATPQTPISDDVTKLSGAACYALATWTATFAVIGLALRFLSGFSAARRYIADASYWIYIIHLPIVMALQVAVSRLDWPWPAKFVVILAVAFPVLFASYQLLVRYSVVGAVLNGRRMRKPA